MKHFIRGSALVCLALAGTAIAHEGLPDLGFGEGAGSRVFSFAPDDNGVDDVAAVLVRPDRRILLVGTTRSAQRTGFTLVQVGEDGGMDAMFGQGGIALGAPPGEYRSTHATAAAMMQDGRVVVAGFVEADQFGIDGNRNVYVCRYLPDGTLDASFGGSKVEEGCEELDLDVGGSLWEVPIDVKVDPAGRVLLAGYATRAGDRFSALGVRLTDSGALDPTFLGLDLDFKADGWSIFPPADYMDQPLAAGFAALERAPDGHLFYAMNLWQGEGEVENTPASALSIFRATQDGFIAQEQTGITFPGADASRNIARAVALSGNRVLLAGDAEVSPGVFQPAVLAFDASTMAPDPTFGIEGAFADDQCGCQNNQLRSILAMDDGRVLLVSTIATDERYVRISRLTAAGEFDKAFGTGGSTQLLLDVAHDGEIARGIALQGTQAVIAAQVATVKDGALAVTRVTGDRLFLDGFE